MNIQTVYKKISAKEHTILELYENMCGKLSFLLESDKGRFSYLGRNPVGRIIGANEKIEYIKYNEFSPFEAQIHKANTFEVLRNYLDFNFNLEELGDIDFKGGFVGYVSYDSIKNIENIRINNIKNIDIPEIDLLLFDEIIALDSLNNEIYIILNDFKNSDENTMLNRIDNTILEINSIKKSYKTNVDNIPNLAENSDIEFLTSKSKFINSVNIAKEYIENGDVFQVVLSRSALIKTKEEGFNSYKRLRKINFSDYMFYINFSDYEILGSSPEILVKKIKRRIFSCPIAGTRRRGKNEFEDKELEVDLLSDTKERSEHNMLVDLSRNDIGRLSKIGKVEVTKYMKVEKFSHVMHLVSLVEGELKDEYDSIDVLASCIPAGTVSGAPKIRAMEIIEELEEYRRGFYAGGVGYFSFDGNMDLCIAIRSSIIKDGQAFVQAGAGIVAESIAENEYKETEIKLRALISAYSSEVI